jgi:multisubunit Na+/H+ antiporter MnhG subunit
MALISINFNPSRKQLRQFGAICLAVFVLIAALVFHRHKFFGVHISAEASRSIAITFCVLGIACIFLAAIAPQALRPIYVGLTVATFPIGWIVSHIILAILFFGILTPIGLVMRLIGRDTMQRRFMPNQKTYWEPRETVTDPRQYFRQF